MKNLLIFCISTFPFLTIGQTISHIGVMGGLDFTYRVLNNKYYNNEIGKLNYRFGVNYDLKISKRFWLETGLRFSSLGYNTKKKFLMYGGEYDVNTGIWSPDPSLPHEFQIGNDYFFLEIPINLKYQLGKNKWNPFLLIGISPNIYLTTKTTEITELYTKSYTDRSPLIKNITYSVNIGFGFDYSLSEKYQLFVQPSFRYHFTKLNNGYKAEYLYSYGIELGVKKKL